MESLPSVTTRLPPALPPALPPELAALLPPALHPLCDTVDPARGTRLFATGARPAHLFFMEHGEAVLERTGLHGELVVLQRSRRGFIGEASLQFEHYHCDARVLTDAHITRVPVGAVRAALASDPAFASRWIGMLNREVRRLRLQCERLALHRVQDRVLHLLATEGEAGRYPVPGGLKSLAAELGVTHEALYRSLAALEQAGRLAREAGALRLLPAL